MKIHVIAIAIAVMLLVLLAAVAVDSVRYASDAWHRVELADAEMRKHEQRLVTLLSGSQQVSPEVAAAITSYQAADSMPTRHEAYDALVASFRQTMSGEVDPTNPLDRAFMDDIAGAINRREVSEKQFDSEYAAYQQSLNGFRGHVARLFSTKASKTQ